MYLLLPDIEAFFHIPTSLSLLKPAMAKDRFPSPMCCLQGYFRIEVKDHILVRKSPSVVYSTRSTD